VFLVRAGDWFTSNGDEWTVAMSRQVRRESLAEILPAELVDDVDRATAAKAEIRSLVRQIQQQVRSELLPAATADIS